MAVVTTGNETIVRYSAWLIGLYYVLAGASVIIAVLSVLVAVGVGVGDGGWRSKAGALVSWGLGAPSFAFMGIQMYTMGRAYASTWVAIGSDGVRLKLPRGDGDLLAIGAERRFRWDEIAGITIEKTKRMKVCRFSAGEYSYTLTRNNCPSFELVANLLVERKGAVPEATR
jgi:hypothetical protein